MWKNDFLHSADSGNMRIKYKITVQNDTESGYLFRHNNRGKVWRSREYSARKSGDDYV